MDNTLVAAKNTALGIHKIARREFATGAQLDKVRIGRAVLNEANILAVVLVRSNKAMLFGDSAHLGLR